MDCLLDSHPVLWSIYEPHRLSTQAADLIYDPNNALFVSLASLIEISHKAAFHRLPLVGSTVHVMLSRLDELGCVILNIHQSDVLAAAALPLIHTDPFDRLLIAQARTHGLTLITKDQDVIRYPVETIW